MEDELFTVLLKMVNVQNYPSVPYDIYRYFTLLEDLDKNRKLNLNPEQKSTSFDTLSYDQIEHLGFSHLAGTRPSKQSKKIVRMIDDEAVEVALYLIKKTSWPQSDHAMKSTLSSFIANNSHSIRLYIRDVTTMVYSIFVFLSLRNMSESMKTEVLFQLNQKIKGKLRPAGPPEPEEKVEETGDEKWVLWGKNNKSGEFLIVKKSQEKETPGSKCINMRVSVIESFLDKERIRDEYNQILKKRGGRGRKGEKKFMCEFLKQHLIKNKRYYV